MTPFGGVSEENVRKHPTDIKEDRGCCDLQERMNDDGALIIDGPTGKFCASGFRLAYGGAASSIGGGLGSAASQECARKAGAFVIQVSPDGAIKLFAGGAAPVQLKHDTSLLPPQIRKRYPVSLKPCSRRGGDDYFFGREAPLEQLLQWVGGDGPKGEGGGGLGPVGEKGTGRGGLPTEAPTLEPFILISGIGGVGKSQLAAEVLHRCEIPRTKIWINASSPERLQRELAELWEDFREAGIPVRSRKELRRWLEGNKKWLMVVDNLEDPELLWNFVPRSHKCLVMITTRDDSSSMFPPPKLLKLDILERPSAESLLQTLGRQKDEEGSARLAEALGCLPLALVMASSLVAEKKGLLSFSVLADRVAAE
uniref:NB-ARC domain-containing protein n=1 Tax=Chromera velia CCMP2878 TaxID=1169474 RepID=A0A0G4FBS7_9ALVE|eukprot:Cvel_16077.t1-p1 / transcript=Cvel_16077.t1 / gene=Cvel_16077 / organism=Chromera_velia_CCMP2878 / gene_product=hypothetical protein / transcript_product=hypothetical protein / location=Cvel_scaffold1222:12370-13470(+) / protein_length=367 / sequence_SO=supercontig / SO=protein_coding / is_pseudo=false